MNNLFNQMQCVFGGRNGNVEDELFSLPKKVVEMRVSDVVRKNAFSQTLSPIWEISADRFRSNIDNNGTPTSRRSTKQYKCKRNSRASIGHALNNDGKSSLLNLFRSNFNSCSDSFSLKNNLTNSLRSYF